MSTEVNANVIKRNGVEVIFDKAKIINAVQKANEEVPKLHQLSQYQITALADTIATRALESSHAVNVEDIQDMVEHSLMDAGKFELAKQYIIYRYKRALVRKANTTDDSILSLIRNSNKDVMEENSNKNATMAATQRDLIAGEVSKDLTKRIMLPAKISKAHEEGVLHFHDADYFIQPIFNCCLINIGDMLDNGTALIGQAALQDTMKDIIVDAIGALVMSTIGYISLKYKKGWVEKLTLRFHVKKPEKAGKPKRERMNEHER